MQYNLYRDHSMEKFMSLFKQALDFRLQKSHEKTYLFLTTTSCIYIYIYIVVTSDAIIPIIPNISTLK